MLIVQGDVFLTPATIPAGATKRPDRILARGEATGHSHALAETDDAELFESDGVLYLRVTQASAVQHEEHARVLVPPGEWKVGVVQEYDPFLEEARKVRD